MSQWLRRDQNVPADAPAEPTEACPLTEAYPALDEFLTLTVWDDGSRRETGTLLLCTGDGRYRAWLNDRDAGVSAWVSSGTLSGLLEAIEKGLREGGMEWRVPKGRPRR